MNKLRINGTTDFMGIKLPVIEYNSRRYILAKNIAEVHGAELKEVNQNIKRNRKKFKKDIDIIDVLNSSNALRCFAKENNLISSNSTKNVYILSETGYAALLNIIDEFDVDIVRDLYINYFNADYFTFINIYERDECTFFNLIKPTVEKIGLTLKRQFTVGNYRVDGYIPELKLVIEYDENDHRYYNQTEERNRQAKIQEKLKCSFVRVSDKYEHGVAMSTVLSTIINLMNKQNNLNIKMEGDYNG